MITISEVIEACAQAAESTAIRQGMSIDEAKEFGEAIRDLAAQYEGCIVAEDIPRMWVDRVTGSHHPFPNKGWIPLYHAKEPTQ